MQQIFVEDAQIGKEYVTITGADVRHLKNVLRIKTGEKIRVSSDSGRNLFCEIAEIGDAFIQADIIDENAPQTELSNPIYLFQALPKGDRMETVIEKCVELGVYEIIPVAMKYCIVKLDAKKEANKLKRWQSISETAAKQSKRSIIPTIHSVMTYKEAIAFAQQFDHIIVPYENERGMAASKEAFDKIKPGESVAVFIGPEGGFAQEEISLAAKNADIISLGRRILRTDTAAITTLSMLMINSEINTL